MSPLLLLALPSAALGATLTVGSGSGYDHNDVQDAILDASSGDTISIAGGTWTGPFDTRGRSLTLQAAGTAAVTLTAPGDTVLAITRGETVSVIGLTLSGGDQGVELRGSTLFLTDSVVEDNGGAASGVGLGIFENSSAFIQGCTIQGNEASGSYDGGGLYVRQSSLEMGDTEVLDNRADRGGGLLAEEASIVLDQVTFRRNAADSQGGAIRIGDATVLAAVDVTIESNTAGSRGGGVASYLSDTTWTRAVVRDNSAGSAGGGLAFDGVVTSGSTFSGEISGNQAAGTGGGVLAEEHPLTVRAATIRDNSAGVVGDGGGIAAFDSRLTLTTVDLTGNSAEDGGGIWLERVVGTASLVGSALTVTGNTATADGGGIWSGVATSLVNSTVADNVAGSDGGGLLVDSAWLTLTDVAITTNGAGAGGGGVLLDDGFFTLTRVEAAENSAGQGGGLYLDGGGSGTGTLATVEARANTSAGDGGGIVLTALAELVVDTVGVHDNQATGAGGGLFGDAITSLAATGLTATGNTASYGGGLLLARTTGRLTRSRAGGNTATESGGGVQLERPTGPLILRNLLSWENAAPEGAGLQLSVDPDGHLDLSQVSLAGNDGDGLGLLQCAGSRLHQLVAAANTASGLTGDTASASITLAYAVSGGNGTDWDGGLAGRAGADGNQTLDCDYAALVVNGDASDDLVSFSSVSPCRDAGDPSVTDLDGSLGDPGHLGGPEAWDEDLDEDGVALSASDCDDTDPSIYPGAADAWYDGRDSDCAGDDDNDADGDGYGVPDDCDDTDAAVYPGAPDSSVDGIDQDCDGDDAGEPVDSGTDDGDDGGGEDNDGDGFGPGADCDDADPAAHPDAPEICDDGLDNDCDGFADDFDSDCTAKADDCGCASRGGAPPLGGLALALGLVVLGRARRRDGLSPRT